MSTLTVLVLCIGSMAVGFLAAAICQAASSEYDIDEVWQQGREYGHAEIAADRDRAVTVHHPSQPGFRPFDWSTEDHAHGGFQP